MEKIFPNVECSELLERGGGVDEDLTPKPRALEDHAVLLSSECSQPLAGGF